MLPSFFSGLHDCTNALQNKDPRHDQIFLSNAERDDVSQSHRMFFLGNVAKVTAQSRLIAMTTSVWGTDVIHRSCEKKTWIWKNHI